MGAEGAGSAGAGAGLACLVGAFGASTVGFFTVSTLYCVSSSTVDAMYFSSAWGRVRCGRLGANRWQRAGARPAALQQAGNGQQRRREHGQKQVKPRGQGVGCFGGCQFSRQPGDFGAAFFCCSSRLASCVCSCSRRSLSMAAGYRRAQGQSSIRPDWRPLPPPLHETKTACPYAAPGGRCPMR